MEVVERLAEEENISQSKCISLLVEAGLRHRGIYDESMDQLPSSPEAKSLTREDGMQALLDQHSEVVTKKTEPLDDEDLKLLKKLKMLKELGLL